MKRSIIAIFLVLWTPLVAGVQSTKRDTSPVRYGANPAAFDDPATFNATVERFLRTPLVKIDRVNDVFTSLEKMRAAQARPYRLSSTSRLDLDQHSPRT